MKPEEERRFRAKLVERGDAFRRRLDSLREHSLGQSESNSIGELSTYDNHPGDLGTSAQFRSQDLAFRDEASQGLAQVEDALGRLRDGTYGTCRECGGPIERERLEALPEAARCADCENEREARSADRDRPIEEDVLSPPFGRTFTDDTENVAYDGEDAWQDVARVGTSETPSDVPPPDPAPQTYPNVFVDAGERRGAVEDVESLPDDDERDGEEPRERRGPRPNARRRPQ